MNSSYTNSPCWLSQTLAGDDRDLVIQFRVIQQLTYCKAFVVLCPRAIFGRKRKAWDRYGEGLSSCRRLGVTTQYFAFMTTNTQSNLQCA